MLKSLPLIALMLGTVTAGAAEPVSEGATATPPVPPANAKPATPEPESELDREIKGILSKKDVRVAVLINNTAGRALDQEGRIKGMERLGQTQNATDVLVISDSMVPDPVVELYTSIKVLPASTQKISIIYTYPKDDAKPELIGYIRRNMDDVPTKVVRYDGATPWLQWITGALRRDDAVEVKPMPEKAGN